MISNAMISIAMSSIAITGKRVSRLNSVLRLNVIIKSVRRH